MKMSTSADKVDHRKRPRNRTTQSCLNCHASKRMCNRKRPACSRCIKMGLSGTCTYEVDDPKQGDTSEETTAHLRRRITELERFIKAFKNHQTLHDIPRRRSSQPPPDISGMTSSAEESNLSSPRSDSVLQLSDNRFTHPTDVESRAHTAIQEESVLESLMAIDRLSSAGTSESGIISTRHVSKPNESINLPRQALDTGLFDSINEIFPESVSSSGYSSTAMNQATIPSNPHWPRNNGDDLDDILAQILNPHYNLCKTRNVCVCEDNQMIDEIIMDLLRRAKKTHDILALFPEHYNSSTFCNRLSKISEVTSILSKIVHPNFQNNVAEPFSHTQRSGTAGPSTASSPGSWPSPIHHSLGVNSLLTPEPRFTSTYSYPRMWDQGFSAVAQHAPGDDGGLMSWKGPGLGWP